jgi:hypothetical protein
MPAIPLYQQRTQVSGSLPASASPQSFGAGTADAGQRVASALENVGAAENQALRYQELNSARAWAGSAASQAQLQWTQTLEERKQQAEPGAPGFTPKLLQDFDDYSKQTLENAPDEMSRRFVQQHLDAIRSSIGTQAVHFQAGQQVAYNVQQATDGINNWAKSVQQDPSAYSFAKNAINETMPYPGAIESEKLQEQARKELTNAAASNLIDRDPYKVVEYTGKAMGEGGHTGATGIPWIDDATPEQVKLWNSQANVRIRQLEADARRGKDQDAQVAIKEVQTLREFTMSGRMMDPDYVARVREVTAQFPDLSALAERYIKDSADGAAFGSQSLPMQQEALSRMRGQPTNPEQVKVMELAQRVNTTQTAAAKEDPWAAGSAYWRLPEQPLQNITDPVSLLGTVAARNQAAAPLEAATGFPVSPLRPDEAKQAADMLGRMSIPDRTNLLGQVGKMLPPERMAALADQLDGRDKVLALTLKLGSDVTTAGRMTSELVQLGAQALSDKTVKKDDTALAGWRSEIATLVRGTLGNPKVEQDVIDAAYYVRAAQELDTARAPGFTRGFGSGAEDALKLVIGTPVERGGMKTFLPRGMTESDFDTRARATLAPLAGKQVYLRGQPMPAEALAGKWDSYGLRLVRPGEYVPISNGAQFTLDPSGTLPLRVKVQ